MSLNKGHCYNERCNQYDKVPPIFEINKNSTRKRTLLLFSKPAAGGKGMAEPQSPNTIRNVNRL